MQTDKNCIVLGICSCRAIVERRIRVALSRQHNLKALRAQNVAGDARKFKHQILLCGSAWPARTRVGSAVPGIDNHYAQDMRWCHWRLGCCRRLRSGNLRWSRLRRRNRLPWRSRLLSRRLSGRQLRLLGVLRGKRRANAGKG